MKRIIVLILLFCGAVIFPPNNSSGASSWQQIWGPVGTVMGYHDVIKGTSVIYATEHSTGDIYRYDGNPFKWTKVGGPGSMFAVDSKGSLYGLSPDKKGVFRYTGTPGKWTQIGGPAASIYAGGDKLYATNPQTGDIAQYNGTPMNWTKVGGPGNMFAVDTKGILYGLSPNQKVINQYTGTPGKWTQIGGPSYRIYAGGEIFAIGQIAKEIFRYDGIPLKWTKIGGPGSMFVVSSKGDLYGLSPNQKSVNQYTGIPGKWTQIGGPAAGIYAGGEILLATSPGTLNLMAYLPQPIPQTPAAPTDLTASALSTTEVTLSWKDNANNEIGIKIERKGSGGYVQVGTVGTDVTNYNDSGLAPGTTYSYRIKAYNSAGDSPYSNEVTVATLPGQIIIPTIIKFYINNTTYYIDNVVKTMDTVPIIMESRTLLPVRYVAEPLGADVKWDTAEQKATVILKGKTIEMWINNPVAKVNGVDKYIDPDNQAVKPIIVPPGRTMLPLRFIAENLDCKVDWDEAKQEVTVTYPKP